ncbi:MAG: O-antigen ligase family protein [Candidatus Desantisbacteria bacterium]
MITIHTLINSNRIVLSILIAISVVIGIGIGNHWLSILGIIGAGIFLLVCFSSIEIAIAIFLLSASVDFYISTFHLREGIIVNWQVSGFILSFLMIVSLLIKKDFYRLKSPLLMPLLIFVGISILSSIFNSVSLPQIIYGLVMFLQFVLCYFIGLYYGHSQKVLRITLPLLLIIAGTHAMAGIYQYIYGGAITSNAGIVTSYLQQTGVRKDIVSFMGNANNLGGYLMISLSLSISIFYYAKSMFSKVSLLLLIGVQVMTLFLTNSRGAWVGFVICILGMGWILKSKKIIVTLLISVILSIGLISVTNTIIKERIASIFHPEKNTGRVIAWYTAILMIHDNPLLGKGLGSYGGIASHKLGVENEISQEVGSVFAVQGDTTNFVADNHYVLILAETGILGLVAFLWILYTIFKNSLKTFSTVNNPYQKSLCLGFLMAFLGICTQGLSMNIWETTPIAVCFWFLSGLVASMEKQL